MNTYAQSQQRRDCAAVITDAVQATPPADRVSTLYAVLTASLPDDEVEALGNMLGRYPQMKLRDMRTAESSYVVPS
tara:strand:+ start:1217 stop:1444 length:228 start_codon:yes stop_codon:yes gene_type:complete